jgi:hypothetical protein
MNRREFITLLFGASAAYSHLITPLWGTVEPLSDFVGYLRSLGARCYDDFHRTLTFHPTRAWRSL